MGEHSIEAFQVQGKAKETPRRYIPLKLQFFGGRGAASAPVVSFERSGDFDYNLFGKLPKKNQVKNITDIGKERHADGTRYRAIIKFEDGLVRSIGEYTLSDFKYYVDQVLNHDRNIEL